MTSPPPTQTNNTKSNPAPSLPLHLTIRFASSIPDIDLDISSPQTTTVLSLKHILRNRLSTKSRLRLIHQGRLLPDTSALSSVLKAPLPPPPRDGPILSSSSTIPGNTASSHDDPRGKGKAVARTAPRIYINCSLSDDPLSAADLAAEAVAAALPPETTSSNGHASPYSSSAASNPNPAPSVHPRPKGFDRLLQSGFTHSEVSTLRTQFATIHSDRFASDGPPSPDAMRNLEDAWIDSNAGEALPSVVTGGGGEGGAWTGGDESAGMASMLDTLIKGLVVGFFFPLGSMTWLLREEVWSDKWRVFVGGGAVFSLAVGLVMGISGN